MSKIPCGSNSRLFTYNRSWSDLSPSERATFKKLWVCWLRCMVALHVNASKSTRFSGLISRCSLPGHSLPGQDTPCPERFPLQIGYMQPRTYTPAPLNFLWWGLNEANCSLLRHCAAFVCLCNENFIHWESKLYIAASQPVDMYSLTVGKHVKSQTNKDTWVANLTNREKTQHQSGSVKDNTVAGTNYCWCFSTVLYPQPYNHHHPCQINYHYYGEHYIFISWFTVTQYRWMYCIRLHVLFGKA